MQPTEPSKPLPTHTIAQRPTALNPADFQEWDWASIAPLTTLRAADSSSQLHYATQVRLCADDQALYLRFDCEDEDIWGTLTERDDPVYNEEVVELFIAPGTATPTTYYEFELTPNGVLLDVEVYSPHGDRTDMQLDTTWDCQDIAWFARRNDEENHWWAGMIVPWRSICPRGSLPSAWRANFYRIERPRHAPPEYSCWSPTFTSPPDFHRAARFGTLYFQHQPPGNGLQGK